MERESKYFLLVVKEVPTGAQKIRLQDNPRKEVFNSYIEGRGLGVNPDLFSVLNCGMGHVARCLPHCDDLRSAKVDGYREVYIHHLPC